MKRKLLLFFSALALVALLAGPGLAAVSASGLFHEPEVEVLHTFSGENIGDGFGWVAENLGDINNDNVNDLIIPAPFYGGFAGKVYIFSGKDFSLLNTVVGNAPEQLGYSVTSAQDVDNDGTPDYVIGSFGTQSVSGRALVFSGADHSQVLALSGDPGACFGASVAGTGDTNGDGYGDILVGAPCAGDANPFSGRAYLFSGQDGSILWANDGFEAGDFLGTAVGRIADLNGDGYPEAAVGSVGAGTANGGAVYVYSGATGETLLTLNPFAPGTALQFGVFFTSDAGDVNGDGLTDIYVGDYADKRGGGVLTGRAYVFSGADGSIIHVFNAEEKGEGIGPGRGVGDVDGDGHSDVIIGAYRSSEGAPLGGKAYLFSGKKAKPIRTFTSLVPYDQVGVDALAVGDINQDGQVDYLVTGVNFTGTDVDHSYLIAGTP